MNCRACGRSFTTDRIGKQAWYCRRPECDEERAGDARERDRTAKRERVKRRKGIGQFEPLLAPDTAPLLDDLLIVARLAADIGASPRVLRECVITIAKGEGDMRFTYRRLAAVALALAAHVGGKRL